jgi:hypothetical protein
VRPSPSFGRLRDAYRHGDSQRVIDGAPPLLDELRADAEQAQLVPLVLLVVGGALAAQENYVDALTYLHHGLSDLFGEQQELARRELGPIEQFELLELDLMLLVGRYRETWPVLQSLAEPARSLEARLGATRAHLALAAVFGDFDTAHQLLNTAAGLADQLRSHQLSTIVDGDRAVILAAQGRVAEAAAMAAEVLPKLARPGPGPQLAWSTSQAVTVATATARAAARAGDASTAERLLASISKVAERPARRFDAGQVALARGVVWSDTGHGGAEQPIAAARRTFLELGCLPAAALAQLEEARVAIRRGYRASARPLLERARAEYDALQLPHEVAAIDALLSNVGA